MEEIRIYHSVGKTLPLSVLCLICAFFSFSMLFDDFTFSIVNISNFYVYLFPFLIGCYGAYRILCLLKERLFHQPFMTITDKSITVSKLFAKKEINFKDVVYFYKYRISTRSIYSIWSIHFFYRSEVKQQKLEGTSGIRRYFRNINLNREGRILFSLIDTKAQRLFDLLNERLAATKKRAL